MLVHATSVSVVWWPMTYNDVDSGLLCVFVSVFVYFLLLIFLQIEGGTSYVPSLETGKVDGDHKECY